MLCKDSPIHSIWQPNDLNLSICALCCCEKSQHKWHNSKLPDILCADMESTSLLLLPVDSSMIVLE